MAETDIALGIDLGTSYTKAAVFRNGKVEVIKNLDGNLFTPSFVAFSETDGLLIGEDAKAHALICPENSIYDVKRLIGREFKDLSKQINSKPFKIVQLAEKPVVELNYNGSVKVYTPEEINSVLIAYMKEAAEEQLGVPISSVVLTVPANFNYLQRQAVKDSALIAGVKVLHILSDSVATALYYALVCKNVKQQNVIIFDLGGGSLDVSIISIENGNIEVKSTAGNTCLGGDDFNDKLVSFLVEDVKRIHHVDVSTDKKVLASFRASSEQAINDLSSSIIAKVNNPIPSLELDYSTAISQSEFEKMNIDLFNSIPDIIEKTLKDANLKIDEFSQVLLVGGSSNIPFIKNIVRKIFNGVDIINPSETVVSGAAIAAAIQSKDNKIQHFKFSDIASMSLGTATSGEDMSIIIPRLDKIPAKHTNSYSTVADNQTKMMIGAYQGELPKVKDNLFLGKFTLDSIPPAPKYCEGVSVTFDVDVNGILTAIAHIKSTKKECQMTFDSKATYTKMEIARMAKKAKDQVIEEKEIKKAIEVKNALEVYCYSVKAAIEEDRMLEDFSATEKEQILRKCGDTISLLEAKTLMKHEDYKQQTEELEQLCRKVTRSPAYLIFGTLTAIFCNFMMIYWHL